MERARLAALGVEAVDEIMLGAFRVDISKALDPLNRRDFLAISNRIRLELQREGRTEVEALRIAFERLDVDWPNLTTAQRTRVIASARRVLKPVEREVVDGVADVFVVEGDRVVKGTRRSIRRRFDLNIPASLTLLDRRVAKLAGDLQTNYVRDEYRRRRVDYSRTARSVVSDGLERGLGRGDIVDELDQRMLRDGIRKSRNYWNVVSMSFTNHARSFSEISGYEEAGIDSFRWDSVLDEATTNQCRFMHGKTFSVASARRTINTLMPLKDPERITEEKPWMREGLDREGNLQLFLQVGDRKRPVAQVAESAVGMKDEVGRFSKPVSDRSLERAGVTMPPLHGLCRSTLLPEV